MGAAQIRSKTKAVCLGSWLVMLLPLLLAENDVGGMLGRLMFGDAVAERG
jgi:hypothetical protein